jgi:hypothetical protein
MASLAQAAGTLATILAVQLLIGLALAGGIAKCWSICRRPGTNTKCVVALMLLLIACLIPSVSRTLSLIIPIPFAPVITLFSVAVVLSSAVLAVIGLRECSQHHYTQGRAQATWVLVLSAIVAILPIAFLAQARWNFLGASQTASRGRVVTHEDLNFKSSLSLATAGEKWKVTRLI